jgi:transcriptional regulator with XRE-family HTH domain
MIKKSEFKPAGKHAVLTTGEVVKMLRELKGWTQAELSRRTKLQATNISLLENNRIDIGKQRAVALARAFGVHPAIIMFPEYENERFQRAA